MKLLKTYPLPLFLGGLLLATNVLGTNPFITDQFTADPTARVFEGRVYVYPSHDIPYSPGKGRTNWFIMEDYHVFSSDNLTDWTDHGMILNQTNVPWLTRASYDMWAPDCMLKNGKYYFYFPVAGSIGVAVADKPYGPFTPEAKPIQGMRGIDPGILMDDDGSAYIFAAGGRISVAKLKDNMLEIEGTPQVVTNLPTRGLIEGPFPFKRKGIYYLTYPHVENKIERLEYATSTNPMGPYKQTGVILDESASGCWTVHQSLVEYKGQWYLFYHDRDLSPNFDKNRSIRADKLYFNDDGTIQKVIPTLRGVGIVDARSKVQIDRYSATSKEGVAVSYLNPANTFEGWKTTFSTSNSWVQFNEVDFGSGGLKSVNMRVLSGTGGTVEIRMDKLDGPVLAHVEIGKGSDWQTVTAKLASVPERVHDLFIAQTSAGQVEIDWVSFQ